MARTSSTAARRTALAAVALALAALVYWLARPAPGPEPARPEGEPPPEQLESPAVVAPDGAAERAATAPQQTAEIPLTLLGPLAAQPVQRGPRWLVVGRLEVPAAAGVDATQIEIWPDFYPDWRGGSTSGATRADGSFEIDVSSHFDASKASNPHVLKVRFEQPRCVSLTISAQVEEAVVSTGPDGEERRELRCDAALAAAAVVTGTVLAPPGAAPCACVVVLYRAKDGKPDELLAYQDLQTGERFNLRAPEAGPCLFLAQAQNATPATRNLEIGIGASVDLGAVALGSGESIAGFGPCPASGRSRAIYATLHDRSGVLPVAMPDRFWTGWSEVGWNSDRFRTVSCEAQAGGDGRFEIAGLDPGEYDVVADPNGEGMDHCTYEGLARPATLVHTPATGVVLAGGNAVMVLHLDGIEHAPFLFEMSLAVPELSVAQRVDIPFERVRRITVPASVDLDFGCKVEGYERVEGRVRTAAPCQEFEVTVAFERAPTGRLEIEVRAGDGVPVRKLGAGFFSGEPGARKFAFSREADLADGVFVLEPIPPGAWHVSLRPDAGWAFPARGRPWIELDVEVVASETVRRSVDLPPCGSIRVTAKYPKEIDLGSGRVVLRDARGALVDVEVVYSYGNEARMSDRLGPGSNDVYPCLPAGEYLMVVTHGNAPITIPVRIDAGRTTELQVDLTVP